LTDARFTSKALSGPWTDVLILVELANGNVFQQIISPQKPSLTLHLREPGAPVPEYVTLGIEHILTGVDHLAFVYGLMLLVRRRRTLIQTITAFTLAHSITLAATTFHVVVVRPCLVEALVALSIVFVAVDWSTTIEEKALSQCDILG